ncbi:hypothetical protein DOTSEDRAFT_45921 [Dothistroma septosporum NZE10]|uniref:Uncharacterized protein n=1 Tax=Dothistroma septosporum (strain NZE10 / CBS 128990) TaxID=675120 RepID=N1PM29_DOTSN|nr:hypothetical protein DOTSEDRAFT_45921 [Dothistroma septosporum NZE10]
MGGKQQPGNAAHPGCEAGSSRSTWIGLSLGVKNFGRTVVVVANHLEHCFAWLPSIGISHGSG